MFINSRGECSTSPPTSPETFAERPQRWVEESGKSREEAAKKRMEEKQKRREERMRKERVFKDFGMPIDWKTIGRRGTENADTARDPVYIDRGTAYTDRGNVDADEEIVVDTGAKKRWEEMRDLDMSRIDYLRMRDELRRMKYMDTGRDPVDTDHRGTVYSDRGNVDADQETVVECKDERQKRREEAMRGIYSFKDLDCLMINERRRRGRRMKIHTDSHGEDMRKTNTEDDINQDIGNIVEKGAKEEGENMDTKMENEESDGDTASSKGVCPVKTDRVTVATDREEVDTDRHSVDTSRDTDRDSVDTGRDSMDTGRDTVDTDRDTVDTDRESVGTDLDSVDTDRDNVATIKETQEDKLHTLGSVVSDEENDDETNREDAKEKKNINLEGKYNLVNEDDLRYDRGNEDGYKCDMGNEHINTFTTSNNYYDDNDFIHTHFTSIHNFGKCSNIQIGNQNTMVFSSTSDTPAFGFGKKNRNARYQTEEFTKARQDMTKLKREEAMEKWQGCDKIKLQIFEDAFKNGDPKGVYGNRWGVDTSRKEQNQNMECEDDDDEDYEKDDEVHKMAHGVKYDDRDEYFMEKGTSDKLNLVLLSKKIWTDGEGCHVNLGRTVSIQELEDVLKLKSFGVGVDHIDRERLGPIHRFEMDLNTPISYYSVQDGDQVILL
ncbi:hypothetical protein SNE40_013625 [Patella caerulea]